MTAALDLWLDRLGYTAEPEVLHLRGGLISKDHPYALEIETLLKPDGAIRAKAVFDVEGVPTVVFVGDDDKPMTRDALDNARMKIWNQNLASVVIEFGSEVALALPARKLKDAGESIRIEDAQPDGPFSALDIASANLSRRQPEWFDVKARVDRTLLRNLQATVKDLADQGFQTGTDVSERRQLAELLMGQVLFLSYLEHREIVGPTYRDRRSVTALHDLVGRADRVGIHRLIEALKSDFNGDFLDDDRHNPWGALNEGGFETLDRFLKRTDMRTGQQAFWNYDFSYIPVELLSGLYEAFLSPEQQAKDGAYYTPRNLAVLTVDQALDTSTDPLSETVFDGACGSGILLTTAYRRLIAIAERKQKRQLSFTERVTLLTRCIFGGDINPLACRVTAFSLYLSLLESLAPADILDAQEREKARLPRLKGVNLLAGKEEADFFAPKHGFSDRKFSLIISNPPWAEPKGEDRTSADDWATEMNVPYARRQIAGAYSLRALDFLAEGGRVCLILPIGQFLGPTSAGFVNHLLELYRPLRLTNFGDLQGLLFPTVENTCHIFLGERRPLQKLRAKRIPFDETFEYLVPKADLSLAFGRLTMQSADRHQLQTVSVAEDPQILVTMMWGDANDLAIWTRLSMRGTFADFWSGPPLFRRWVSRKGIHLRDASRNAVDVEELPDLPHIPISSLRAGSPVLHRDLLSKWPENQTTVVGLNDQIRRVFDGPRVLFPDGFSRSELNVRAVYFDGPATFTHSIGVIAGKADDAPLLQFAAVYLRSSLARYFLMMRGWKMLCDRNGVHLREVEAFPFFSPKNAPDPEAAKEAVQLVVAFMEQLAATDELRQSDTYQRLKSKLDKAVFSYFGLSQEEQDLISETVELLMPSIRPRGFESLDTPAQGRASHKDIERYGTALGHELTTWRERMGGHGRFEVTLEASEDGRAGALGVVRISYDPKTTLRSSIIVNRNTGAVLATLAQLRRAGLHIIPASALMGLVADTHIWVDGDLYIARPLNRRSWTIRQALRDAERIVRRVQAKAKSPNSGASV